jgi:hypothetical protein
MGMVIVKREDMKVFCFLSLTPIVPQIDTPLRHASGDNIVYWYFEFPDFLEINGYDIDI